MYKKKKNYLYGTRILRKNVIRSEFICVPLSNIEIRDWNFYDFSGFGTFGFLEKQKLWFRFRFRFIEKTKMLVSVLIKMKYLVLFPKTSTIATRT